MDHDSRANRALTPGPERTSLAEPIRPALELRGITKRFHSVTALDTVSLCVTKGTVHALLGENGAGKTTLMRIAFGMVAADSGYIARNGARLTLSSPRDAIVARIGMVHQQFSLVPAMTVAENVALGGTGIYRFDDIARRMKEVARETGLELDPAAKVASLSSAERQKLEIVRILAHDADFLILDEPTAVLTPRDTGELFIQLRRLASSGRSVILITHKLQDALDHADDVSVLRHGRMVLNASMRDVTREVLTSAMLGGAQPQQDPRNIREVSSSVVARISIPPDRTESIEVHNGEILGVAAIDGAATNLLRLFAALHSQATDSFEQSLRVGFVPENRLEDALIPGFTLTENLALRNAGERRGLLDWRELREATIGVIRDFDVRAAGPDALARTLSGGNQQRFVLGRELSDNPALLVLENPTHGLDVKAAAAVHQRMRAARNAGIGIVFYSSDLDELADLSDRVVVVSAGGIAFATPGRNAIGRLLLGDASAEHAVD